MISHDDRYVCNTDEMLAIEDEKLLKLEEEHQKEIELKDKGME
jgi:ABC-type siderophore export system fused ATPase/permease subunit